MYNVEAYSPDELTARVKQEQEETSNLAVETLQWFLDDNRIGELYPRPDVVQALSEHLEVDNRKASIAVSSVVGDIVDPVQQVTTEEGKFVGVIEYKVYHDSGAYAYIHFDDRQLQRKRVVCAKCVEEADLDGDVSYAEQGEGTSNEDVSWEQLLNKITSHYANAHNEAPEEIEPGAKLLSDTTISGNTAFHAGNESNIDHNNLSNRTHSGDDLTPSSVSSTTLEAGGFNFIGEFQTLSDFDAAAESGDRGYITEEQQFARQP